MFVECCSTQASSARNGTRTLRPILTVGRTPTAIISYAVARPTPSLAATSSARRSSLEVSKLFVLATDMFLLYSSTRKSTIWTMNSSKKVRHSNLAEKLDKFLDEFANASDFDRLGRMFGEMLPPNLESAHWVSQLFRPPPEQTRQQVLQTYQDLIRQAWVAPDDGQRRYFVFMLRSTLYEAVLAEASASIPRTIERVGKGQFERRSLWKPEYSEILRSLPRTRFDDAIDRLGSLAGRTKKCGNTTCETPYFIAARKSQRYCNETCANLFQQQAKREWWRAHGKEWREQRQEKTPEDRKHGKARTK